MSSIQPQIGRITDRLDNPAVDENENPIDVIYAFGTPSEIRDPWPVDFTAGLLDRFDDEADSWNLAHLCSRLYNQHNPEIVPRLRAIAEKYGKKDALNNVVPEANSTIRRLLVDWILESGFRQVIGLDELVEEAEWAKKLEWVEELEAPPQCDHEFEFLKMYKKYTVYRCTKCGGTMEEFN